MAPLRWGTWVQFPRYKVEGGRTRWIGSFRAKGSISEIKYYATYDSFLVALRDLFGDPKRKFISTTLPDGKVLDEAAGKALPGFAIGASPIGGAPLG
jgi:hypothetical protein